MRSLKTVDAIRSGYDDETEIFSGACALEALKLSLRTLKVQKLVRRSSLVVLLALVSPIAYSQTPDSSASTGQPTNAPNTANDTTTPTTAASKPWIVRDPATGRVFQQQLVPVNVPVTRWEARTVDQTVYEPRIATQLQQTPQTTYVPNTRYVMQPKVTGWWNPFKQPVQAYQYVPVTNWVPQTQQISNPVTTQQWVPRQQKIVVYQPVQATETRQQLVQTELPQPQLAPTAIASVSAARQPLFRLPILAQQRVLPWPAPSGVYGNTYAAAGPAASPSSQYRSQSNWQPVGQPATQPTLPNASPSYSTPAYASTISPPQYSTTGLRPVANLRSPLVLPPLPFPRFAASPYSAPLQTTTSVSATASRDTLQSGMQPTVLR